jgi:hypothetical protein
MVPGAGPGAVVPAHGHRRLPAGARAHPHLAALLATRRHHARGEPALPLNTAAALTWVEAEAPHDRVARFRRAFALIWLVYDLLDLVLGGTAATLDLPAGHRPPLLTVCQLGLVCVQVGMALGRPTAPLFAAMAVVLRAFELTIFPFNDFYYYIVVCLLLTIPGNPRWRHDVLLLQTGWIYAATALLKVNADWLSGGHLFVRAGYLWNAGGWPHIGAFRACSESLDCTGILAKGAIAGELLLAALLFVRRGRPLAIVLAVGIHLFAALMLNVWFFGASMVAQVALLFPTRPGGSSRPTS